MQESFVFWLASEGEAWKRHLLLEFMMHFFILIDRDFLKSIFYSIGDSTLLALNRETYNELRNKTKMGETYTYT